jgi:hypothetical protein
LLSCTERKDARKDDKRDVRKDDKRDVRKGGKKAASSKPGRSLWRTWKSSSDLYPHLSWIG